MRQKRYHDRKLEWHIFSAGDLVYVYFPRRRIGTSPKLTSFWQGPVQVFSRSVQIIPIKSHVEVEDLQR